MLRNLWSSLHPELAGELQVELSQREAKELKLRVKQSYYDGRENMLLLLLDCLKLSLLDPASNPAQPAAVAFIQQLEQGGGWYAELTRRVAHLIHECRDQIAGGERSGDGGGRAVERVVGDARRWPFHDAAADEQRVDEAIVTKRLREPGGGFAMMTYQAAVNVRTRFVRTVFRANSLTTKTGLAAQGAGVEIEHQLGATNMSLLVDGCTFESNLAEAPHGQASGGGLEGRAAAG